MQNRNAETAPSHVLIVNDDESLQAQLESIVRKSGMLCETATGPDAVRKIVKSAAASRFAAALIVDGTSGKPCIEYAAAIVQNDPYISCILILCEPDNRTLVRALRLGVCDAITLPLKTGETLRAIERAVSVNRNKRQMYRTSLQARDITKIHRRLMIGTEYELKSFRPDFNKRLENAFFPAYEAGGDFGRCLCLDDNRLLMIVGDTSGHDIKSAFVSVYFMGLGRGLIEKNTSPDEVLEFFNNFLVRKWNAHPDPDDIIMSMGTCYVLLDFEKREISCSSNGAPSPILFTDTLDVVALGGNAPPLGWFDQPPAAPTTFPMPLSGCIVAYTDGLMDMSDGSLCPMALADAILGIEPGGSASNSVFENQADDVYVQRFAWTEASFGEGLLLRPLCSHVFFRSDLDRIDEFQARWEKTIRTILPGLPRSRRREILLVCREALINAVEHGHAPDGNCQCRFSMACHGTKSLRIRIKGDACPVPYPRTSYSSPKSDTHIPFGMKIIHGLVDSYVHDVKNNSILLDFNLASNLHRQTPDEDTNELLMILP